MEVFRMKTFLRRFRANESGAVMVLFALLLTALGGFSALVMDIGQLVVVRQRLTNVADAAVLSGARLLPDEAQARQEALLYAQLNGVPPENVSVSVAGGNRISATLTGVAEYGFARLLGFDRQNVMVTAEALAGPVKSIKGAVPLGIVMDDFIYGESYYLKLGSQTPSGGPHRGNFHALALGGSGANNYRNNLKYGYAGNIEIGQMVTTEPGNMAGPTRDGIEYRLALDPHSTFDNIAYDSPRLLLVPIVDTFEVHGRDDVQVVGLACFFLEDTHGNGEIKGRFHHYVTEGEIDENAGAAQSSLTAVKLIR
jgi:Flp pilus assembly pilin Flp